MNPRGMIQMMTIAVKSEDELPPLGEDSHWEFMEQTSDGKSRYRCVPSIFTVTFVTDDERKAIPSDRLFPDVFPRIPERSGYDSKWILPRRIIKDITIEPRYYPTRHIATFVDDIGSRKVGFSIEQSLLEPIPRSKTGFVAVWEE